uniref:Bestrophin homolog n=1 Tax=Elaeophora elaphi TaxID=1147741 RepID=A0A158Q6P8_9BILA
MTVSYHFQLASLSPSLILRVLFRWKGSVWKHIYKELLVWTIIFLAVSFFYRSDYFLNAKQKTYLSSTVFYSNTILNYLKISRNLLKSVSFNSTLHQKLSKLKYENSFEKFFNLIYLIYFSIFGNLAHYFDTRLEYIPITFILGFFVDTILSRWSSIFINMGYIESYAFFIVNYIHGESENAKRLRRTLARYLCLTQVFVFRDISAQVQKRFPTIDSMIDAGILLKEEKEKLDLIKLQYNKYWTPIRWIHSAALKARKDELITSDLFYWKLCAEVDAFRHNLQLLYNYDWVPIPLVYSQVVFLAVYVHFLVCLISRQFIISDNTIISDLDLIIPVMTIIEFVFFIGWLKVAQALLNPFGDDDDDFECNYLIDKNLAEQLPTNLNLLLLDCQNENLAFSRVCVCWTTSLCIADNYDRVPEIQPDLLWRSRKGFPASMDSSSVGSAVNLQLELTVERANVVNYHPHAAYVNAGQTLSYISLNAADQEGARIMKHTQTTSACNALQIADHFEESINRTSLQLAQYNKLQTEFLLSPNPSMNKDKINETEITQL